MKIAFQVIEYQMCFPLKKWREKTEKFPSKIESQAEKK